LELGCYQGTGDVEKSVYPDTEGHVVDIERNPKLRIIHRVYVRGVESCHFVDVKVIDTSS